ncbi:MAG: polysaccharide deacetylase family protein [Hyphomicrobiaceae bacterium]|nr:polysaccharide deacetylase family protein [Hyphomicrobiaceae bacterium]
MLKANRWASIALAAAAFASLATAADANCPGNPNALGVSRVVEIDTTGGPGFGFEHFRDHDFLRAKEVVLTFDDGPWPGTTQQVLKALEEHCAKAIFFVIGKHSMWHPDILRQVAEAGHTIGTHTFSHQDLSAPKIDEAKRKAEIEMGISAARRSLGDAGDKLGSFFRFPALRHPPEMMKYVGERNLGIWSTDIDSFDFKLKGTDKLVPSILKKLEKHGKGIVLMHDFQKNTAQAASELLTQLKANGYKLVHVRSKGTVKSIAEYDAQVATQIKGPVSGASSRPTSSVVKTISEVGK